MMLLPLLALISTATAANVAISGTTKYVEAATPDGQAVWLKDARKPALYTQNFGDCLGSSLINVTRFDAAYYKDNMTVLFHLEGNTNVANESLMMYIGVFAYGEARFDLTFNPCNAQIYSLCPMNRSVPIEANGIIPVSESDVAGIPPIALNIPDFEGQAILRIFANSTQSQVGCYSAVVTNGATFSHPAAVGTVLGIFTIVAIAASFATAVYGNHIPTTRTHYAHSLSVLVVFSVFHHIFFTGSLSVNWPSVLPAFWSNFAWSGGMIYSQSMQNSVNQLIGSNKGNTSIVGAAGSGSAAEDLGGGYEISQIYKRSFSTLFRRDINSLGDHLQHLRSVKLENHLAKRALANATEGYNWYGTPVKPGLPLPGNFSGFAGTLAQENIPASNAFMTGFLWFLILIVVVAAAVVAFKWILEALVKYKQLNENRLVFFREHWLGYTAVAALRTTVIGFFMIVYLALFQFTYKGSAGVTAIAALVFVVFFFGIFGLAGYACYYRLHAGSYAIKRDRMHFNSQKVLGFLPWVGLELESQRSEKTQARSSFVSMPWWGVHYVSEDAHQISVQQDEDYIKKFGWLAARFRRTRWWFFALWLTYEFVRACFYGGAAGHPMAQVFGLMAVEFIALITIVKLRPFEGARLNALMVYLLGFSKVATLALSAAFDIRFNLARINTTVIGVVIIVIQGLLASATLLAIVFGAISSYMSVTRDREAFRPRKWEPYRERYFAHLEKSAPDAPTVKPTTPMPEAPKEPYFRVASVRREPKIEDSDPDCIDPASSRTSVAPAAAVGSRTGSRRNSLHSAHMSSSNLPFGARSHRTSWSTRDFSGWQEAQHSNRSSHMMSGSRMPSKASEGSSRGQTNHERVRTPARSPGPGIPLEVRKQRNEKGKEKEAPLDERSSEEARA
ncbi:MAG: hypothetical protein L6R38_003780 [Xanthoria sp. 2 TBL-2021]|nr:MAG: hypothetical protein L6R38_003780 [Xanthoria sp. 2 TBL-2021]